MTRYATLVAAYLFSGLSRGEGAEDTTYAHPMQTLKFNGQTNHQAFERASLATLGVDDPYERWNRRVYHFNYHFDNAIILPIVNQYRQFTPPLIQTGIGNIFNNLGDVSNLINSALQLKGRRTLQTTGRLLINTTVGVVGMFDLATRWGLPRQPEDFGQTLGRYGASPGPYLVLPLLGPSNLRDTSGLSLDLTTQRLINYLGSADISNAHPEILGLQAIVVREQISFRYGQLNSPFEYEKVRYIYTRSRALQIAE